jgi:hypothetical protein
MDKEVEEIRNRIVQHSLNISRIPLNTKKRFLAIANEEDFCSDYGMALKFLLDLHDGIFGQMITDELEWYRTEITMLKDEVAKLKEQGDSKEQSKVKMSLDGKRVLNR